MAKRKQHRAFGQLAGAGTALLRAEGQGFFPTAAETAGGFFGGILGSALPDIIEPATTPHHRGRAHSVAAAATIVTWVHGCIGDAQRYCREQAARCVEAANTPDGLARALALLMAALWHFAAGFFAGVEGGYVSHLVLDAGTPAGLPTI